MDACPYCEHDEHGTEQCMPKVYHEDIECRCTGLAQRDALAESHAELVAALEMLLHCRWVKETASHEVNLARTALLKARALVPGAGA